MEGTTAAASERRVSRPPLILPKPGHESVQDADPHLVLWDGPRDSGKAVNWSPGKKWLSAVAQAAVVFCVAFASAIPAPASNRIAAEFGSSADIMILDTVLFLLGNAVGTIIWSPLNDLYGRQLPLYIGFLSFAVFQIPVAVAENLATVFVCRFIAGVAGCAPLITVVSSITDLWSPLDRGLSMSVYACAMTMGPAAGPLVGGFVSNNQTLGWRWTSWIILVASVFFGIFCWLFHSETSAQVLLRRRPKLLGYTTKDWALHAPVDEAELNCRLFIEIHVWKPLVMLFTEPMLLLITLNMSFAYGLLFLFVETFPLSYVEQRHWEVETAGLPFISIIVGALIGCIISLAFALKRHTSIVRKYGRLCPEERLLPFLVGSICLPTGIFVYAWTAVRSVTPIAQIAAGVPPGIGFLLVILQGTNYLLDVYALHAGAVVAVKTTVLSAMAAAFAGFGRCIFRGMGTHWVGTLLGIISIVLIPIPVVLFKLGIKIRATSNFTKKLYSGSDNSRCSPVQGLPEEKV